MAVGRSVYKLMSTVSCNQSFGSVMLYVAAASTSTAVPQSKCIGHPLDRSYVLHDVTAALLEVITGRLPLAQRSLICEWDTVAALVEKADRRYQYLRQQLQPEQQQPSSMNGNESAAAADASPCFAIVNSKQQSSTATDSNSSDGRIRHNGSEMQYRN